MPVPRPDGPLTLMQVLPVVAALQSLVLTLLSQALRGGFLRKALTLFATYFLVDTGLSLIEAIYFNGYLHLSQALLVNMAQTGLVKSLAVALAGALLWNEPASSKSETLTGLVSKLPLLILAYNLFYFGAGQFIAWQSAALRAFYTNGMHIHRGELALLQIARGAIWVGLAWSLALSLKGSALRRAVITGLSFSVLMAISLLYPNDFMPWAVRSMHLIEIGTSNLLYGLVTVLVLMHGARPTDRIQPEISA